MMNFEEVAVNAAGSHSTVESVTPGRKSTRHPPGKWLDWELSIIEKCYEAEKHPSQTLRLEWASVLTEKRLRNLQPNPRSKENFSSQSWLSYYKEQVDNWLKGKTASGEGEALGKGKSAGLDNNERSSMSSFTPCQPKNKAIAAVQQYVFDKGEEYKTSRYEEKFSKDTLESEEDPICLDDDVFRNGSRLDILAHLASLRQPLPVPGNRRANVHSK